MVKYTASYTIAPSQWAARFTGYDNDDYLLLGMAVKYAGLHGVDVTVHGRNHETF
jgi:hypothetical protein